MADNIFPPGTYNYIPYVNKFGKTWGWGSNNYGEIGRYSAISASTPVAVCGNHTFCSVSHTNRSSFGLDNKGKLWGWGYNNNGELGTNNTVSYSTPVAVCGTHTFFLICAGYKGVFAIDNKGKTWGWGYNGSGVIGDNTTVFRSTPVAVCGTHTFCKVTMWNQTTAIANSFGIDNHGKLWAWGQNTAKGNLGINVGTIVCYLTPVAVCGTHTFCQVSCGDNFGIAIDNHGKAWGWGYGTTGAIGNNNTVCVSTPVAVCGIHTFCKIFVKGPNSLAPYQNVGAIDNNGKGWSWGANNKGQIGDNTSGNKSTPVAIYGNHTFCNIFPFIQNNNMMIDRWGVGWSWGDNTAGVLGNNTGASTSTPVKIWNRNFLQYTPSLASIGTPYIDSSGKTWGWGYNQWGEPGINLQYASSDNQSRSTPVAVCGNHTFCQVVWGYDYHMGIDNHGKAWAWGHGTYGQLGNNATTICILTPVAVYGNHTFCKLAGAPTPNPDYTHSLGLDNNGKLWAWGSNSYGQIGNNAAPVTITQVSYLTPVAVCGNHTFCIIKAGRQVSMCIDNHGKAWSWGRNSYAVLGNYTINTSYSTPIAVCGNHTFCDIDTDWTTIAIDNHGKPWVWGCDDSGELGRNTQYQSQCTPVAMCGNHTFCLVAAGNHITAGVDNRGQTWIWGYNASGDLGTNNANPTSTPVTLWGDHKFIYLNHRRGEYEYRLGHSIDEFGFMWSWGQGKYGFMGNNSVVCTSTPVSVYGYKQFYKNTGTNPTVTTTIATNISDTIAITGGNVTSDGGSSVTSRGVCWGTSPGVTISGNHTTDGTGTGVFVSLITGLTSATKYYYNSYVINGIGTSYGTELNFTTLSPIEVIIIRRVAGKGLRYFYTTSNPPH